VSFFASQYGVTGAAWGMAASASATAGAIIFLALRGPRHRAPANVSGDARHEDPPLDVPPQAMDAPPAST
jgi:hypothetical protein